MAIVPHRSARSAASHPGRGASQIGRTGPPVYEMPLVSSSGSTAASSQSSPTSTSSSVNTSAGASVAQMAAFSAHERPWRGSKRYRSGTGKCACRRSTTARVASVELLSATTTSQRESAGRTAASRSSVSPSKAARLKVGMMTEAKGARADGLREHAGRDAKALPNGSGANAARNALISVRRLGTSRPNARRRASFGRKFPQSSADHSSVAARGTRLS